MNEELLKLKEKIKEEIKLYFPEDYNLISSTLDLIDDEEEMKTSLINLQNKINAFKQTRTNKYYVKENGGTYYGKVEEDERIYDSEQEEDKKIIAEALYEATKDFINVDPKELTNEKEYTNLIKVDVIYDEQLGYRVIEKENGRFHGIQKESSWFLYPSKNFKLDNDSNVKVCNDLFGNNKQYNINDELLLDGITPAEIFMPYLNVINDPVNKLTAADVLIKEGIYPDENFKNSYVKDLNIPDKKNVVIKGSINIKEKEIEIQEENIIDAKEDIILEPTKYIEGTFIPYPRNKKENESTLEYNEYLINHYKKHGYVVKYDEKGNPIYPHENRETIIKDNQDIEEKKNIDDYKEKFGFSAFIKSKGITKFAALEPSVKIAYLKNYKLYLERSKSNNKIFESEINKDLEKTIDIINNLEEKTMRLG